MAGIRTVKEKVILDGCSFDETSLIGVSRCLQVLQSIYIHQSVNIAEEEVDSYMYRPTNKSSTLLRIRLLLHKREFGKFLDEESNIYVLKCEP